MTIEAPFTDGLVTDAPAHLLGPRMASKAVNVLVVDGAARKRPGWLWTTGASFPLPNSIRGVRTVQFALLGTTRRVMTTGAGAWLERQDANEIKVTTAQSLLPRCVYNDELILCNQNGLNSIRRFAGVGWNNGTNNSHQYELRQGQGINDGNPATAAMSTTAGSALFSYTLPDTNSANIVDLVTLTNSQPGWFLNWDRAGMPRFSSKIIRLNSTNSGVLGQAISGGGTWSSTLSQVMHAGFAYPAVSTFESGSITVLSGTVTGEGTAWESVQGDLPSITATINGVTYHRSVGSISSNTSLTASLPNTADPVQYRLTQGLPFKDACVWKRSLVGCGVAAYPNRVYICPPGWDLESPPGSVPPLWMRTESFQNEDPNYFLVDFIDVPSTVDTDPCVAVLPTPGPLLVLKENAVYGIYGDSSSFSQSLIREGAGCIDLRSTVECEWGQFWAGRSGIFRFTTSGGIVDITQGRISTTWRNLVAAYRGKDGFYCAAGQSGNKMIVSIGNSAGGETLCYDVQTGAWDGFLTNHQAVGFDSPPNEETSLVWAAATTMAQATRLRNSGRMLVGGGPASDGAGAYDPANPDSIMASSAPAAATSPALVVWTGTGMNRVDGITRLAKMIDVEVSASVVSPTGVLSMTTSPLVYGGIGNPTPFATTTRSLAGASPPPGDSAFVRRLRYRVNLPGRLFGVAIGSTRSPESDQDDSESLIVNQITVTFRESRERA